MLDPASVMLSYNSEGGTGPRAMAHIGEQIHAELAGHKAALAADAARVSSAYDAARAIAKAVGPKGANVTSVDDLAFVIDKHRPGARR